MRKTWWQTLGEFLSALVMSPTYQSFHWKPTCTASGGRQHEPERLQQTSLLAQSLCQADRFTEIFWWIVCDLSGTELKTFSAGWEVHVVLLSYSQSVHDPPSLLPYENKHCKALSHVHVDQHPFLCRAALRLQGRGFDSKILFRTVKVHVRSRVAVASCAVSGEADGGNALLHKL